MRHIHMRIELRVAGPVLVEYKCADVALIDMGIVVDAAQVPCESARLAPQAGPPVRRASQVARRLFQ